MQLQFKELGSGRPVILLHGLLGSSDNWHSIARRLAEKFHVFALDQRNHGHSPHSDQMNFSLMSQDLNEFLLERNIASTLLIGHSMGGKTAMQFALLYPDKVEKLLIEDMAPRAYAPSHDFIFSALHSLDLTQFAARAEIESALASNISSLVLRRFLLKNLDRNVDGKFFWRINLSYLWGNYPNLGQEISHPVAFQKPVLFIRGGKSDYLRAADEPLIRRLFPQAVIQTIPEAAHWVHADQPEKFLTLALDFL